MACNSSGICMQLQQVAGNCSGIEEAVAVEYIKKLQRNKA